MYLDNYETDSENGAQFDQENSVNGLHSSAEKELPKRINTSWNGETDTVLVYDRNIM